MTLRERDAYIDDLHRQVDTPHVVLQIRAFNVCMVDDAWLPVSAAGNSQEGRAISARVFGVARARLCTRILFSNVTGSVRVAD